VDVDDSPVPQLRHTARGQRGVLPELRRNGQRGCRPGRSAGLVAVWSQRPPTPARAAASPGGTPAAGTASRLSRYHFYDGTPIHRIIPDFVIQGGDPTGTGSGGPGYEFDDELPSSAADYRPGTVAMANAGADTNGSQFFVDLAPTWSAPVSYSIFGKVTEGMDSTIPAIAAVGTSSGDPTEAVTIVSVTVADS
jgi:cyclophilin family peptidyl-prolyl cis-trans isomerase